MSGITSEVSLSYFCVCNVSLGETEGQEDKKILYFFPKTTDIDTQIKEIGLCQAIIKFSRTFSKDPCECVFTEKTKRVFYEAEPNIWFIMSVNGGGRVEGLDSVVSQCYESVRMFLGPLERQCTKSSDNLKKSLEPLLTRYLMSTVVGKLVTRRPSEVFHGLHFLPLDRTQFLQGISLLNRIESLYPDIHYSLILHADSLLWSGLPAEDTQVVFRYLTMSLLPTFLLEEKQNKSPLDPHASTISGRFVCGPKNLNDLVNVKKLPKLYLHGCKRHDMSERANGFYHMIVYRLPLTTVAWFLTDGSDPNMELYRTLEKVCREELQPLVNSFKLESESCGGGTSSGSGLDCDIRYVYFNKMNLAVKAQPQQSHVSALVLSLYSHHDRLLEEGCMSVETIMKTSKESWVCARTSNYRHFFLTSDKKRLSLDDFNKEVNRICNKQLSTIFFHV